MTASLEQIATAIFERLDAIDDVLNAYPTPVGSPDFPAVMISPPLIDPRQAMRAGVVSATFDLVVLGSSAAGYEESQSNLWPYLDWQGERSIFAAFDQDPTLGLEGVDAKVLVEMRPLGLEEIAATQAFGSVIPLTVHITHRES